jgi:signal transduction histidine kinase
MKMPKWVSSLKLGMKLALACAAIEFILLLVVIGTLALMSKTQLDRYNLQREAETRHLLSSAFADPLVRKNAAGAIDVANRLIEGDSDLVMLEVVNLSDTTVVSRTKQNEVGNRLVEADIEVGGYAYGQVRFALSNKVMKQERLVLLTWVTGVGIFAIMFSVVVFMLIGHILTTRLRNLAACADRITAGDSYICLPDASEDEVGHLSEAFATMTRTLKQRFDDLTEAKLAAEAASRAKSTFLANMSHELRTPMNGVMGMIDLALRRSTDTKQTDMLNKSKGAAQRMVNVINDIIDFSKAEADRLLLEEKSFSLSQMIDDAIAMQDITAQAKGLILTREIPATFPDQLSGDAFRLRQILLNFLGNACKFSDQGMITVRVSAIEQDVESVLARIEVEDQGIGISPEHQAMLFQSFAQVDDSMTRKYGGSGLGLIISKRLANLMGGDVGVVSREGHGSTFWATVRLKLTKTSEVGV